jgi:hypothetical protein
VEFTNNPVLKSHFFVIILTGGGNGCSVWVKITVENAPFFLEKSPGCDCPVCPVVRVKLDILKNDEKYDAEGVVSTGFLKGLLFKRLRVILVVPENKKAPNSIQGFLGLF